MYLNLPPKDNPYNKLRPDASKVKIVDRVGIEHRSVIANLKIKPGHFEADTIFGHTQGSFLLTLADKANKSVIIRKLTNKCAETGIAAFGKIIKSTLYEFKPITADNVVTRLS
jgi:IS30 family transposase